MREPGQDLLSQVVENERETLAHAEREVEFEAAAFASQSLASITEVPEIHQFVARAVKDMAPKTIGIKITDEARSLELVRMALQVAEATLAKGGAFVAKVFMGGDFQALKKELQARFDEVRIVRPQATRESSYEVYVLGKGFRGGEIR